MAFDPLQALNDQGDTQTRVMQVLDEFSSSVGTLSGQFTEHAFFHDTHTLIALVPHLMEGNYYNLGMILHYIQRRCKHSEFREVLYENEISPRMAAYLMAIYVKFSTLKIPCPVDIPWRTLGEAVRIINALNYEEIVTFCRQSSAEEVRAFIRGEV